MFIFLGEAYTAAKLSILSYNEQIKEARKHKNLRQKDLALNLGLSPYYISKLEKGTEIPALNLAKNGSCFIALYKQKNFYV